MRLHEKGGKRHEMPTHHNLETYLDEYIAAAGIRDDGKSPLFRSAVRRGDALTVNPMRQMLMAKQHLDRADIGSGFEEVGSKAVAQGMAWEVSLKPVAFARDLATGFRAAQALGSAWPGSTSSRQPERSLYPACSVHRERIFAQSPDRRRTALRADHVDQSAQRGRNLPVARIIQEEAAERGRPLLQHPD